MLIEALGSARARLARIGKKVDHYLLVEVMNPFLGALLFLLFVFLMFQVLRLAEMFIVHGMPFSLLGRMVALLTLSFLPMALPVAFLLAVLLAFARLSADSELVAMKACGISIWRMTAPVLGISAGVVALSLALNLGWVPWAENELKSTLTRLSNTEAVGAIKPGTFNKGFYDLLIYADEVDPKTGHLKNVFIFDEREPKTPFTVVAANGGVRPVETPSEFGAAVVLELKRGNIHQTSEESETYQKINFSKYSLYLEIEEGEDDSKVKPRRLPMARLLEGIADPHMKPRKKRRYRTELWRRFSIALSPFVFVFLGIGFGTVRTRSARASAVLVTFVVVLLFWTLLAYATTKGFSGKLPPAAVLWLPNLAVTILAIFGFKKATW
ncbi:MAG: LPS export ABC transporter permease LptF [Bdellovibrionales bacterium]|nr:LPS export ABC transporter permease LptF [Bdellovibrionales bacterium]